MLRAGTLTRDFKHLAVDLFLYDDEETGKKMVKVERHFGKRKNLAAIRTAVSHIQVWQYMYICFSNCQAVQAFVFPRSCKSLLLLRASIGCFVVMVSVQDISQHKKRFYLWDYLAFLPNALIWLDTLLSECQHPAMLFWKWGKIRRQWCRYDHQSRVQQVFAIKGVAEAIAEYLVSMANFETQSSPELTVAKLCAITFEHHNLHSKINGMSASFSWAVGCACRTCSRVSHMASSTRCAWCMPISPSMPILRTMANTSRSEIS